MTEYKTIRATSKTAVMRELVEYIFENWRPVGKLDTFPGDGKTDYVIVIQRPKAEPAPDYLLKKMISRVKQFVSLK